MNDLSPGDLMREERVRALCEELYGILAQYLFADPEVASPHMERAHKIRAEIESLGFFVRWHASIDASDPSNSKVHLEALKPREDIDPEARTIYEEWLRERVIRFSQMQ